MSYIISFFKDLPDQVIEYYFRSVQLEKKNAPEYTSSENTIEVNSLQLVGEN